MSIKGVLSRLNGAVKFKSSIFNAPILHGRVKVTKKGELQFGKHLHISGSPRLTLISSRGKLEMGNNIFINDGVSIHATHEILIGDNVKIGPGTRIMDNNYHLIESTTKKEELKKPIKIGNNVFIGADCLILPGVEIDDNSVIAAGSVVTKSISKNILAGGNPAKKIRELDINNDWIRE